ncbi:hypothetical protein A678_03323 [Salmonella enterica subsp. enterica serovar Enteritidis str. 2010K-0271]|nr:hypothetical protein A679_04401 [Salmonella enterica subsp. enterica serovar Enteritidis str. 2010K-0284]EPI99315.1 hypothetical protein A678_03323 [Salmonella enterica subsp. enterica serovar Enteritidis str. 2010K-0271]ESA97724.1 hypothetical protein HMPREF1620_01214 [Escherichia coli 909945-2]ESD89491.1 hypothetical protein HMPREF1611_01015 [Escherichia coli 908573]
MLSLGIRPPCYGNWPTYLWETPHLTMGISPPCYGNWPTLDETVKNVFTCLNFVVVWRVIFNPQRQGSWISC